MNPQELGGELLVPPRLAQDPMDVTRDDPAQAQGRRHGRPTRRARRLDALRRQILGAEHRVRRHRDRALDGVLQLADIPGPVVRDQQSHGLGSDVGHGLGVLGGIPPEKVHGEDRDVLASLPQRRYVERHHAQTIEEILPELPARDQRPEIAVGGGDDPHVHPEAPGASHTLDLVLLEDPEELRLDARADLADLVEEAGAGVRRLEEPALVDHRSGEGALHVPEELGFQHAFGQSAAVDGHEWAIGSRARRMDGPRDQLLPGPGLPLDQHGAPGAGHARDRLEHLAHRRGGAHDVPGATGVRTVRRAVEIVARTTPARSHRLDRGLHEVNSEPLVPWCAGIPAPPV